MNDFIENHLGFENQQNEQANIAYLELGKSSEQYLKSYTKLSTLQAWNAYIMEGTLKHQVYLFYVEAQNDALLSHLLARQGLWRPALQSLRSCLENILVCHYYVDHPVELALWELGEHRIGFAELRNYFESHPNFRSIKDVSILPFAELKDEYAELSKAVHGSSNMFLMGDKEKVPNVYVPDTISLGRWLTRQSRTLKLINQFLLIFYSGRLMGTAYPMMRVSLREVFSEKMRSKIKSELNITLS